MSGEPQDLQAFAAGDTDTPDRIICHVDVDCFYAACERLREPALRGEPLVVGMGYEPGETHGVVATASYEAREYGVESAMAISEALDRLPRKVDAAREGEDVPVEDTGFYRPVDMSYYESIAADVKAILHEVADTVREMSVDEAYLDVSDRLSWRAESAGEPPDAAGSDPVRAFARDLKTEISESVGVDVSAGVAPTMSAAKIASDHDKPDGLVIVPPGEIRSFLAPLPVEEIHNVGPVTASELREMGIETAGDLASASVERLRERFGERGVQIRRFARGEDPRAVEPVGRPKSLSRESAFTDATTAMADKRTRVRTLAEDVAERAERKGALYRTIGIKVVTPPFDVHTRAESLPGPVQDEAVLTETALDLLEEFADDRVRKVGVRVSNLSFSAGEQAELSGFADASTRGDDARRESTDAGTPSTNDGTAERRETGGSPDGSSEGQRSISEFE